MELLAILKLIPYVVSSVEVLKRFIPKKKRKVVAPVLAGVMALIGAYLTGGTSEVLILLGTGGLAAAGAMGTYKIPKEISRKMGLEPPS